MPREREEFFRESKTSEKEKNFDCISMSYENS